MYNNIQMGSVQLIDSRLLVTILSPQIFDTIHRKKKKKHLRIMYSSSVIKKIEGSEQSSVLRI